MDNSPLHHHQSPNTSLNLKSLRTKFALRFLRALKKIQQQEKTHKRRIINGGSSTSNFMVAQKYNKVKVAADASMAAAVGPRRAWSRAMLSRIRLNWRRRGLVKREIVTTRRKRRREAERGDQSGHRQAHELRRLVPGGEVMDYQGLLDETAHYIKCLTTQVKVMRSIVNYCSTT
ncbi:hypothetical protein BVRB_5g118480 [Beta vulgaris subsp. vulgaris]|nr:hypothetical protein BVRB_5g118480 [Beta vulgaris subsp. vulgaris]